MPNMRAALFDAPSRPFRLDEIPIPVPQDEEVLVRVAAAGICGGDLHRFSGGIPVTPLPSVIGHQVAGIVEAKGAGVPITVAEGTRVAVLPFERCGSCKNCLRGNDHLCSHVSESWSLIDGYYGGYAEFVAVPHRCLVQIPDSVPLTDAASLTDAIATPFHAVHLAEIHDGDVVAVFGVGDLGSAIVQLVNLQGGIVVAVDVQTHKLDLASRLGARYLVNAADQDAVEAVRNATGGEGADIAFEAAGTAETTFQAIDSVCRGGKVILVGATDQPLEGFVTMPHLSHGFSLTRELTMIGAWAMTAEDVASVVDLRARNVLNVDLGRAVLPLGQINEAFQQKASGELTRVVLLPG